MLRTSDSGVADLVLVEVDFESALSLLRLAVDSFSFFLTVAVGVWWLDIDDSLLIVFWPFLGDRGVLLLTFVVTLVIVVVDVGGC